MHRVRPRRPPDTKRAPRPSNAPRRTTQGDPALQSLWGKILCEYFPERSDLNSYVLRWSSRRQRRVLASCNVRRHIVSVARELDHPDYYVWLEPLLYHEMCHAVIGEGVARHCGRRAWHGAEFRALEQRHPQMREFDRWIRAGGFRRAVRRARAREMWQYRPR